VLIRWPAEGRVIIETRKVVAIRVADAVGHSRLAGADEKRPLAWQRAPRSDLIDPIISVRRGRVFKRSGECARVSAA
jgi:adenylate cyclase